MRADLPNTADPGLAPIAHGAVALGRLTRWLGASRLRFVLLSSLALVLGYNLPFWRESVAAVGGLSLQSGMFLLSLAVILIVVHALLLLPLPGRRILPLTVASLFVLASVVTYYQSSYNVYFDSVMVRNVFETDGAETASLLSTRLIVYVALLGVLPATIIARVKFPTESWRHRLGFGAAAFGAGTALVAVLALAFSANLASYLREHKPLRYLVNPASFLYGAAAYATATSKSPPAFEDIDGPVQRLAAAQAVKPLLVFLVVGETARAANFELGGYGRDTNPHLRLIDDLAYFSDTSSCGTSTATSVPCIFSSFGRGDFDVEDARHQSNLLDAATKGDVDVEWRDNNSGCKHVCDRVPVVAFRAAPAADSCPGGHCFDEAMMDGLKQHLGTTSKDRLIVFHQTGGHGPAYFEGYGRDFEVFKPTCRSSDLAQCDREAIVNAYDNTIVHTDFVLAQQIEFLKSHADDYDSLLIYVSDHGESLGEKGLYLHAAPYFIAPSEQTHVPMLLWMSDGYRARAGVDAACVETRAAESASHDDVYHTVLGGLGLRSGAYRPERDLLAGCRKAW